ncbi:bifunctional diguanylate cyclase/phosphodiesterase [Rhizobium sp. L1K21]|uniref:sensor domain-containing protein n=1 Tax=Rhizobium sp. L1K21 TaxID=2954933 RepID=UPI002093A42B|nr:bifunctional diguanylate cyclase/phosphodiesterase [Rhizobium sp. L1K21]MCO6186848.1 EAL domain-containing protein [Rhizobium sp. L1K21]
MFIFHWSADAELDVAYCGNVARALLCAEYKSFGEGLTAASFSKALLSELTDALTSNAYGEGRHQLKLSCLKGVELDIHMADDGSGGTFWHGYAFEEGAEYPNRTPNGTTRNLLLQWLKLTESSWSAVYYKDLLGRFLYTNPKFDEFCRLKPGEAIGKTAQELFGIEPTRNAVLEDIKAMETGKRIHSTEASHKPGTNEFVMVEVIRQPVRDESGHVCGLLCFIRSLSNSDKHQREMADELGRLRKILDTLDTKIVYHTVSGDTVYMNETTRNLFGTSPEQLSRINIFKSSFFDRDGGAFRRHFQKAIDTRRPHKVELEMIVEAGMKSLETIDFIPDLAPDGTVLGVLIVGNTVAAGRRDPADDDMKHDGLDELIHQMKTVLDATQEAVWIRDADGYFVAVNNSFQAMTGLFAYDVISKRTLDGMATLPPEISTPPRIADLAAGKFVSLHEVAWYSASGETRYLDISVFPISGKGGTVEGSVGIARDITRQKNMTLELQRARSQLSELTHNDPLTGLPNERHARERLETLLQSLRRGSAGAAILLINLHRFGEVNDSIGLAAGDSLLIRLAERIKNANGSAYTACIKGDEFLVQTTMSAPDQIEAFAAHLLDLIGKPQFIDGRYITLSAKIGVVILPGNVKDSDEALSQAGLALSEAKKSSTASYRLFEPEMLQRSRDRFSLEADIRTALENGQFETHFQPKFDLASNTITGAEALMRWRHPRRGNIPPAMFIPLAEETGLILTLGEKTLTDSCIFAREWNEKRAKPVKIAVNLSPVQLMADNFLSLVQQTLRSTQCRPEWLELEITESLMISDQMKAATLLKALTELGLNVAIDDFGTGYSAMSYLISYPISTLKIDRSFVRDVISDQKKAVLVKAIIDMAHGLNMNTVAEGIETAAEAEWIRDAGCREGQGFLWCRAMPKQALVEWSDAFSENNRKDG